MVPGRIFLTAASESLPPEWPLDPRPTIRRLRSELGQKVVVLDDDPTGTQTVHDLPVLTDWTPEMLRAEFENDRPAFFILTNSRGMSLKEAQQLNVAIGVNLAAAAREAGRRFVVISRSDSTLRGHFPGEVEALIHGLGEDPDAVLLMPFFLQGGRYTVRDIHYVADGEWLVPAGQTEYARDPVFGYRSSNLREWVKEKTAGRIPPDAVDSIPIEDLRLGGPERVACRLRLLTQRRVCIVNALTLRDLQVFTEGLLRAELAGKRFVYRTAASFVQVRCGLEPRPPLFREDFRLSAGGGLMIVGSFVTNTTQQVSALLAQTGIGSVEIRIEALLDGSRHRREIRRVVDLVSRRLSANEDVIVLTDRRLVTSPAAERNMEIARAISSGLVDIVRSISVRPRYLLVKGGRTASDIVKEGLGVRRAKILGQILPGVPVWELGPESRHPGLNYVVFPGNTGDERSLIEIHSILCSGSA